MTVKQKFVDILQQKKPNHNAIIFSSDVRPTIEYGGYFGGAVFLTHLGILVVAGKKVYEYDYVLLNDAKIVNNALTHSVTFTHSYANNRLKLNFKNTETLAEFSKIMEQQLEFTERSLLDTDEED